MRAGDQVLIGPREGRMKRVILAAAAGITAIGAVSASAASLGGITGGSLGVDSEVVAACDTDGIAVAYTVDYVAADTTYNVDDVEISGVAAACDGLSYSITLSGTGGTSLGEQTGTVSLTGGEFSANFTTDEINGEAVTGIAVAILS
jgi:hypothetical protein